MSKTRAITGAPSIPGAHERRQNDSHALVSGSGTAESRAPIARRASAGGVMSQPVRAQLLLQSQTNFNIDPDAVINAKSNNSGVSNGHFDFDVYYSLSATGEEGKTTCKDSNTHKHEHDDIYNVTGINTLNPSLPAFNVVNAIAAKAATFKVLLAD